MEGEDFVVVEKKSGRSTGSKRKKISSSEESDDEFIPASKNRATKRSCNRLEPKEQRPKQRLSREDKQYNRALEQAMTESKSSQADDNTTSDKNEQEVYTLDQEDATQDSDSDFDSPDQTLDSDDDFQPTTKASKPSKSSSKPKKTCKKASTKASATKGRSAVVKNGKAEDDPRNGDEALTVRSTNTVQKMQLPGAEESASVSAAPRMANKSTSVIAASRTGSNTSKSTGGAVKSSALSASAVTAAGGRNMLKAAGLSRVGNSPSIRTGGGPIRTGGAPIRTGGGPVIRVGLSRRAPVKQLHKQSNHT